MIITTLRVIKLLFAFPQTFPRRSIVARNARHHGQQTVSKKTAHWRLNSFVCFSTNICLSSGRSAIVHARNLESFEIDQ